MVITAGKSNFQKLKIAPNNPGNPIPHYLVKTAIKCMTKTTDRHLSSDFEALIKDDSLSVLI